MSKTRSAGHKSSPLGIDKATPLVLKDKKAVYDKYNNCHVPRKKSPMEAVALTTYSTGLTYDDAKLIDEFKQKHNIRELWKTMPEAWEITEKWRSSFGNRGTDELAAAVKHVEAWKNSPVLRDLTPEELGKYLDLAAAWNSFHILERNGPRKVLEVVEDKSWLRRFLIWYAPMYYDPGSPEAEQQRQRALRAGRKQAQALAGGFAAMLNFPDITIPTPDGKGLKIPIYTSLGALALDITAKVSGHPELANHTSKLYEATKEHIEQQNNQ